MTGITLAAAVLLALVHLLPRYLTKLTDEQHGRLLSFAGGFSVGFVFVHLLPELVDNREPVEELIGGLLPFFDHTVFLLALVGLVVFYGLERAARTAERPVYVEEVTLAVFALYYAVIGKLLWDEAGDAGSSLVLFTVGMGLHFFVVDYGLREHHRTAYARVGRWILAAAVLSGWAAGWLVALPDGALGLMLGFVAGGVVLIALKEELPADREGRFGWFTLGALLAAVLFMFV